MIFDKPLGFASMFPPPFELRIAITTGAVGMTNHSRTNATASYGLTTAWWRRPPHFPKELDARQGTRLLEFRIECAERQRCHRQTDPCAA